MPTIRLQEEEEPSWIQILDDLLIPRGAYPIADIVSSMYPNLINNYKDLGYLRSRGILTPTNQIVVEINSYIMNIITGEQISYLSYDYVCKSIGKRA